MFELIDHIGVATQDLEAALGLYEGTLGMPLAHRETVEEQGVEAALLDVGPCHVELLEPLAPETPVGKFLERSGPATLAELERAGIKMIDSEPRTGIRNSRVAFVHPKATGSVLTEIVEPAAGH
jgi:methylmalonyl-CoA/ethylmalonyl-CoA epimerase